MARRHPTSRPSTSRLLIRRSIRYVLHTVRKYNPCMILHSRGCWWHGLNGQMLSLLSRFSGDVSPLAAYGGASAANLWLPAATILPDSLRRRRSHVPALQSKQSESWLLCSLPCRHLIALSPAAVLSHTARLHPAWRRPWSVRLLSATREEGLQHDVVGQAWLFPVPSSFFVSSWDA